MPGSLLWRCALANVVPLPPMTGCWAPPEDAALFFSSLALSRGAHIVLYRPSINGSNVDLLTQFLAGHLMVAEALGSFLQHKGIMASLVWHISYTVFFLAFLRTFEGSSLAHR